MKQFEKEKCMCILAVRLFEASAFFFSLYFQVAPQPEFVMFEF